MKIDREKFLNDLNMVKSGLSPRDFIEQSSCVVFQAGKVMTFNDEIACKKDIGFTLTGAVQAVALFSILEKLPDPELEVVENENRELEFRGKKKRFGIAKDTEIFLPIDRVESPKKWLPLPKSFTESLGLVRHCVSSEESRFLLTCVHLHPDYVEACDNMQIMRCKVKTGLMESVVARGTSLIPLASLAMDQIALTKSWLHFKNQEGLEFSCRRYTEDYPELSKLLVLKGHSIVIPKGLKGASDRAAVFASDRSGDQLVNVRISDGIIRIVGEGLSGWYKEIKKVSYDGPSIDFMITPELLKHIAENYTQAEITKDKLKVISDSKTEKWEYITVLGAIVKEEEKEEVEEEE